ncbi:glycosyltransferase [Lentzea flaviverrucosa]|uniref:UDP:flavonoid glycosyltransferase YjiC, YdhE family n=1 Tax=Lentzea flaviverrucosa TaxID=200379 RepID=A0A1H9KM86_9PSEU|nr:glycosyltransferase [Lentzea flaviverrucosa]RDI17922.1 UDP:flavonoid glycosyltransferase YjiC (YdhE family) [Lentzea flaviverrucosa]SER00281.1 UDP:flavonoid glycosyltransferase YjiC, YdhE family [Lentzea flaviverrucosa]
MLNLLFATMPVPGHVAPLLPIARALTERGNHVRWCTGRVFADRIAATGAEFVEMDPSIDHQGRNVDELFPERAKLKGITKLRYDMTAVFLDPIPTQVGDLRKALAERPADLVLHDAAYIGASVFEQLGGPRAVSVGVMPMMLPAPDVPPFGPGLKHRAGALARLRYAVVRGLLDNVLFKPVLDHRARILTGLGLPEGERELATVSPHLHLQNGIAGLEHPRSFMPPQVQFVGALVDPAPAAALPDWWHRMITAGRPIVHVTQGTVADTDLGQLVLPVIRALADEHVTVVASTGAHDVGPLPANAFTAPFLPYDRLLPELSAMVTNGGFGGVQLALAQGVPLVVAGTTEDKPEVAARVERSGAGLNLRTSTPSEKAIKAAVREVLHGGTFRLRARELAAEYRRHDAGPLSADHVERLARAGVARTG